MNELIFFCVFFLPPILTVVCFVTSLVMFCVGKSKNKKSPNSISENKMYIIKRCLIVSSCILAIFILVIVAIIFLVSTVLTFM
jgi:hypothetical protein